MIFKEKRLDYIGSDKLNKIEEWLKLQEEVQKYYIQELDAKQEDYLKIVSNYIEYYNIRAFCCKMSFYITNLAKILGLSGVTIVKMIESDGNNFSTIAAIIAAMCLILEGVNSLFRWHEKWILYRNVQNILMGEVRKFVVKKGIYQDEDNSFSIFVETVENIIDDEAHRWHHDMTNQKIETEAFKNE